MAGILPAILIRRVDMQFLIALGASLSGIAAISLAVVTARAWWHGHAAYDANRKVSHKSALRTFKGEMKGPEWDQDGRTSHGLAIRLESNELVAQRKLSAEAIDDVIGRRV